MAKLKELDKLDIIDKLANGESLAKVAKEHNVTKTPIFNFKRKHQSEVDQKRTELQALRKSILFLALNNIKGQLEQAKPQDISKLSAVAKDIFNQLQITANQPTAISSKQATYKAMNSEQLDTEAHKLWRAIKELNKEKAKLK